MSDEPRIDVIAFDLMDTLLYDPYREAMRAGFGMSLRELFERKLPDAWPAFERGELTEIEYWDTFDRLEIQVDREAFTRARRGGYRWLHGMRELLANLDGGPRRVIASNYPRWIDEVAGRFLDGLVDDIVVSADIGARKPDASFYRLLIAQAGVGPEHIAFLDDRPANVDGARDAGMHAHHFDGVGGAVSFLAGLGVTSALGQRGGDGLCEPR